MRKALMRKGFALAMLLAFALAMTLSCSDQQKQAFDQDLAKLKATLAPYMATAKTALDAIQSDYPFWAALVQGSLQVAGVKVTPEQMAQGLKYVQAADANLGILGAAVNNQPIAVADVQNAITSTENALPIVKDKLMTNPAVAALYAAYLAGQTNVPPPGGKP